MRRIIIASDGSPHAEDAARFIAHFPHDETLQIKVFTGVPAEGSFGEYAAEDWVDQYIESRNQAATNTFDTIREIFDGSNCELQHIVRSGHAGEAIVDAGESEKADLIVIGAKGHSQIDRILLGSTSDFVATHAKCSVLVVRHEQRNVDDGTLRILVAYDGTESAKLALETVHSIPWGGAVEIHVVTVLTKLGGLSGLITPAEAEINAARINLDEAVGALSSLSANVQPHLLQDDHHGEGLVQFAERHQCHVILMGDTQRTLLGRALYGSVSRYVLRHAPCSTWIVRRDVVTPIIVADEQSEVSVH